MARESLDATFFDAMYASTDDPWHFASSEYEREKYDATIAALPRERFTNAFEIGCSIGVLTRRLAERCDALLAVDINERALAAARRKCSDCNNVRLELMTVPKTFPAEHFDLTLLSEVGYYWSQHDLQRAIARIAQATAGGHVVLVHYLPKVEEYLRDGDAVHAAFLADRRFESLASSRSDRYRIDVLRAR